MTKILLQRPVTLWGQKLSLYDWVFSCTLLYDNSKMGSIISEVPFFDKIWSLKVDAFSSFFSFLADLYWNFQFFRRTMILSQWVARFVQKWPQTFILGISMWPRAKFQILKNFSHFLAISGQNEIKFCAWNYNTRSDRVAVLNLLNSLCLQCHMGILFEFAPVIFARKSNLTIRSPCRDSDWTYILGAEIWKIVNK